MNKCSPVEMRKNLEVAEHLKNAGIDFVCVPAKNQKHKGELILLGQSILEEMAKSINNGDSNNG
tara:strand:+ start:311 stop:502 length:192 start_codon:yes stop_codon:yes gene_type:complete